MGVPARSCVGAIPNISLKAAEKWAGLENPASSAA